APAGNEGRPKNRQKCAWRHAWSGPRPRLSSGALARRMSELVPHPRHTRAFKDFTLDLDRGCLVRGGEEVKLRPKVFDALKYLVLNNNRLVTKDELIKALWTDSFVTDDSLVQCLVELRRGLGDEAQGCIKTVPKRGHIFTAEVSEASRAVSDTKPPSATPAPRPAAPMARARRTAMAVLAFAIATVAVSSYFAQTRPPARTAAFTDKDSVLIADFLNT